MATLLFLSGFATDATVWASQIKAFSQNYRVITNSSLIEKRENLFIIGWSLGGWEVVDLYFKFKPQVKGLVFVSAFPKFLRSQDYPCGLSPALLRNLERKSAKDYAKGLEYFYRLMFSSGEIDPIINKMAQPPKETVFQQLARLKSEDYRDKISKIKVPVLLIHGDKDQIVPPQTIDYLKSRIPHSAFRILPSVGHAPQLEAPNLVNQEIERFINA